MNYYWNRNDEIENTSEEHKVEAPQQRNPVTIAGIAYDVIASQTEDQVKKTYDKTADERLVLASGIVSRHVNKGWTEAQAQLYALDILQATNNRFMRRPWMNSFTEKIREQLVDKVSAFGINAYPLTEKQFASAVKAAW